MHTATVAKQACVAMCGNVWQCVWHCTCVAMMVCKDVWQCVALCGNDGVAMCVAIMVCKCIAVMVMLGVAEHL